MKYLYLICALISLGMLFWLKIYDVKNSVIQFINLIIILASNIGFFLISVSTNLEEAILAQKISYVGGIFLPVMYLFLVLEVCHVNLPNYVGSALMAIQCVIFGFVCTIGRTPVFYKEVDIYFKNGCTFLRKVYGPAHNISVLSMCIYLAAALCVAVYSIIKRKSVNRKGVLSMAIYSIIAVCIYVVEKILHIEYELVPIAYDVLMLGALIPMYDSNLYTVYENKDIIHEQLGKVGFLTFDIHKVYKGCNHFMSNVFPELLDFRLNQKIENCSDELQAIIGQITSLEEKYKKNTKRKHVHIHLEGFLIHDRYYTGMIHVVTNSFKKLKGYTIEIHDETEQYRALKLQERYNEELADEVDEKTKRIRFIQQKTILGMAQMVESRDLSTGGHIRRTSDVVRIFAQKLTDEEFGLDEKFLRLVIRSAPMHDLGKIGVDDAVLRKQGRFTDEEYNAMKKHSEIGYRMVGEILGGVEEPEFVRVAENVAHYHHEKVNGMGYPIGLKGEEIPIEARIMALADVFDALVSKRCYKDAYSYDKAFSIIESDAGTHFDERLAKVFLACRPELEDYYNKSVE